MSKNKKQQAFWVILALVMGVIILGFSTPSEERLVRAKEQFIAPPKPSDLRKYQAVTLPSKKGDEPGLVTVQTASFIVTAKRKEVAYSKAIFSSEAVLMAKVLEYWKEKLEWYLLGKNFPPYTHPRTGKPDRVVVRIHSGSVLGDGGVTSFVYLNDYDSQGNIKRRLGPTDFRMEVQGSIRGLIDSTLNHEVGHVVLARHFKRPLQRCFDEGLCVTFESPSSRAKHDQWLHLFFTKIDGKYRTLPFSTIVSLRDYPQDILPLYSQGYSMTEYLILLGGGGIDGNRLFIKFMEDYYFLMDRGIWDPKLPFGGDMTKINNEIYKLERINKIKAELKVLTNYDKIQELNKELEEIKGELHDKSKNLEYYYYWAKHISIAAWNLSLKEKYGGVGINNLSDLQTTWIDYVVRGNRISDQRMKAIRDFHSSTKELPKAILPIPSKVEEEILMLDLEWERVDPEPSLELEQEILELKKSLDNPSPLY